MAHDHDHGHGHGHHDGAKRHNLLGPEADDIAECPVMKGSMVVKAEAEASGLVRDHAGQRYWLCCAACGPLFDADPARYTTVA
ncbi:hypothetical protein MF406_09915 [Georgenia sp. TF02-10]|uniref:hypothetical protein n=1 Tax=Georgenia sp. TF02-10 TaxID=2917725 RepID=UPI001FA6D0ED|nr:hypothetical protein [Georgenia sp. TF02-10]UNX53335.1 hypothetical protein MF406_09915 [Georgenia sp. TF02-10]